MSEYLPPLNFVMAGGISTPYRRMGSGRPVVLVHSLGGSLLNWDIIQPRLARSADVIVYDWGGHGNSEKPMRAFTMAQLAEQLADLIRQAVAAPALLCGVAAGGAICLQCALDFPELVSSLVLGAPTSAVDPQVGDGMRKRVEDIRRSGMRIAVDASVTAGFPEEFRIANPEVIERYRQEFLTVAPQAYAESSTAFSHFDVTSRLCEVKVPVQLLPGELDPYFPLPFAAQMHEIRPDWPIHELAGVGHFEHIQAPDLIASAIEEQL